MRFLADEGVDGTIVVSSVATAMMSVPGVLIFRVF